jgi:hypothetical protein
MRPTVRPLCRRRRSRPCRHRRFCRSARVTSSRALYRALQRSKKHANAHTETSGRLRTHECVPTVVDALAHDAFRRSLTRLRMECDARRDESKRNRCGRRSSLAIVGCVEREEVAASLPKPYQHRVRVKTCGEFTRLNYKLSMHTCFNHIIDKNQRKCALISKQINNIDLRFFTSWFS